MTRPKGSSVRSATGAVEVSGIAGGGDGVYVNAALERDKAALVVVIAAMRDGRKQVLAIARA